MLLCVITDYFKESVNIFFFYEVVDVDRGIVSNVTAADSQISCFIPGACVCVLFCF